MQKLYFLVNLFEFENAILRVYNHFDWIFTSFYISFRLVAQIVIIIIRMGNFVCN